MTGAGGGADKSPTGRNILAIKEAVERLAVRHTVALHDTRGNERVVCTCGSVFRGESVARDAVSVFAEHLRAVRGG